MAKGKGNEMLIRINTQSGEIEVTNENGEEAETVNWTDLENKKIKKAEPCLIFQTNPCVYYLQGGVLKKVCW